MTYVGDWHIVGTLPNPDAPRGLYLDINHTGGCPMSPTLGKPICGIALEIVGHEFDAPAWDVIDKPGFYRARVLMDVGTGATTVEVERMDMGEAMESLLGPSEATS
jgi:hypothetical protein